MFRGIILSFSGLIIKNQGYDSGRMRRCRKEGFRRIPAGAVRPVFYKNRIFILPAAVPRGPPCFL